jgi:CO dehydrogenase/acetyl-CoA synthase beta subunit
MAGKIQLKLKKKEATPAATPASGAAAPAFAMPSASTGGIVLELRGANIHISEVVIKKK